MKKDIQPEEKTSSAEISAANNKATDTDADAGALCVSDAPVCTVKSDPDRVSAISEKAKKYGFFENFHGSFQLYFREVPYGRLIK